MTSHERAIEKALMQAMQEVNLEEVAEEHGDEPLRDESEQAVEIERVRTLEEGVFMTTNRGVVLRLSDGSEFTVEIHAYRIPRGGWRK